MTQNDIRSYKMLHMTPDDTQDDVRLYIRIVTQWVKMSNVLFMDPLCACIIPKQH